MNLSIDTKENRRRVICNLELENCSSKTVKFYIKVSMPKYLNEIKEITFANTANVIVLNARERNKFEITLFENN